MTYLLSSLALLAGPFLFALASRWPASRQGLEGFILVTLAGIVCLHIVPDAWRVAGLLSVLMGLAGLVFPMLLEAVFRKALARAHLVVLIVAAAGIVLHAVLDGIALLPRAVIDGRGGNELAAGVIIHRLPVGIAIWWVLRPQFGTAVALATFALVIGSTGLSYFVGAAVFSSNAYWLALFQSFVAGSLIHVALFGASHDHGFDSTSAQGHSHPGAAGHAHPGSPLALEVAAKLRSPAYGVGLLLGLAAMFLLPHIAD